jgi:hypothetical protein
MPIVSGPLVPPSTRKYRTLATKESSRIVSKFEYLSVLISIVIALGITEVTVSWGRVLQSRERVTFSWLHGFWSVVALFLMVQLWWGFWNFRLVETWTLPSLLLVVGEAINLVLCGLLLAPRLEGDRALDLQVLFLHNSKLFFLLGALLISQLAVVDSIVLGQSIFVAENVPRALAVGLLLSATFVEKPRTHVAVAACSVALLAGFLATAVAL